MKRKSIKKTNTEQASHIVEKIDDALSALTKNEDEISKVLDELYKRDLSETDKDSLNSIFNAYSKTAKAVKKITGADDGLI